MALVPRLELRQSQTLVMTPQLQQAIKMLQLSNIELAEYVEEELERNPMLQRVDDEGLPEGAEIPDTRVDGAPADPATESPVTAEEPDGTGPSDTTSETSETLDIDIDNRFTNDSTADDLPAMGPADSWQSPGKGGFDGEDFGLEQTLTQPETLRDHLINQVGMAFTEPSERLIGTHMVELLDEAGYFRGEVGEIAAGLGCAPGLILNILERLQRFEPTGVFARDLAECLALQLRERNRFDPAMACFIEHLPLLARHDYKGLAKICDVSLEDVADMADEIRALNPRPSAEFDTNTAPVVTPDVLIRADGKGGWIIELNQDTLPRVLVDNAYYATVAGAVRSKQEKKYITDCLQSANWLSKSLHQRATTILKVATEIVRQQGGFFAHGIDQLKPLVLRDVADAIDMHESTVSRVTTNKFMACPRGMFELKYFFTTAVGGGADGSDSHSAEAVRHRIRKMIDDELPAKILSDDKIVKILREEGIDIARRTVAKYRESMRIPSSVQRRREKSLRR